MNDQDNYIEKNKMLWNKRTQYHFDSSFYNVDGFLNGASSLNDLELNLLGSVRNKKILHLQCHFGQDTLSLSRMGAVVTGVDLSETAIQKAKELADQIGSNAQFICCNIYDLPNYLNQQFDIIFTSYGTIGWLPDLNEWAKIIAQFLNPIGTFVMVEFHPVIWMFDANFNKIEYNYFKKNAIIELEENTYADKNAAINLESITWNHSLAEVFTSLLSNGMGIDDFQEYDYSPYDCFNDCEKIDDKKFIIKKFGNKIPMVYSVVARKK